MLCHSTVVGDSSVMGLNPTQGTAVLFSLEKEELSGLGVVYLFAFALLPHFETYTYIYIWTQH